MDLAARVARYVVMGLKEEVGEERREVGKEAESSVRAVWQVAATGCEHMKLAQRTGWMTYGLGRGERYG